MNKKIPITMNNNNIYEDEKALTPVIGEVLLIAIIVVLGAVVASYVMGMGGSLNKTYFIGTTAEQFDEDTIKVTFMGGKDSDGVIYLNVSVNGIYCSNDTWSSTVEQNTFDGDGIHPIEVGTVIHIKDDGTGHITSAKDYVVIAAGFVDGTKQVVLNTLV